MKREVKAQLSQIALRMARSVFSMSVKFDKVQLLEELMEQFTKIVGVVAEERSTEVCKKVQEATKLGFEKFAVDVEALELRLQKLESNSLQVNPDIEIEETTGV